MEAILPYIIQAVSGALGGGGISAIIKNVGMQFLPKLLSGAVGGLAGGAGVAALLGGGDPATAAEGATAAAEGAKAAAESGLDTKNLLMQAAGGLVGGGALTGILGQFIGKKG